VNGMSNINLKINQKNLIVATEIKKKEKPKQKIKEIFKSSIGIRKN
jgi:hypothetical protein